MWDFAVFDVTKPSFIQTITKFFTRRCPKLYDEQVEKGEYEEYICFLVMSVRTFRNCSCEIHATGVTFQ